MRDYGLSAAGQDEVWRRWRGGESLSSVARALGAPMQHVRRFVSQTGGIRQQLPQRACGHLMLSEREEISRGIAGGDSARTIARQLRRTLGGSTFKLIQRRKSTFVAVIAR